MPIGRDELQRDARACESAGARAFHVHPRDEHGLERLDAAVVDAAATAVHDVSRWPVSVSTGAWMEHEQRRRRALVARWTGPDAASVDVADDGAFDVMRTLFGSGIRVEAGIGSVEDAEALVASGTADRVEQVLIELVDTPAADVVAVADAIHAVLDRAQVLAPRLQHGEDGTTWIALVDAVRRGCATRVGLEDVLSLPDGSPAPDNAALVLAAVSLGAGRG